MFGIRRRTRAASLALAAAVAVVYSSTVPAIAAPNNWDNTLGGATTTGGNWSLDRAPLSGDDATFDLDANGYTTSLGSALTSTKLRVGDDRVTLNFTNSRTWTLDFDPAVGSGSAFLLGMASGDNARLTIKGNDAGDNGFVSGIGNVTLGSAASSTGTLTLQTGGNIDFDGPITIGNNGVGNLTINGGTAATGNATLGAGAASFDNSVTVSGSTSKWNVAGNLTLGGSSGGTGVVDVSGDGDLIVTGTTLVRAGSKIMFAQGTGNTSNLTTGGFNDDASDGQIVWTSGIIKVTNSTARVGPGTALGNNVTLSPSHTLDVTQELQVNNDGATGRLILQGGTLKANLLRVNGQLRSDIANALVTAPSVINNGNLTGSMRLTGNLTNASGATITAPAAGIFEVDGATTNAGMFDAAPITRFDGGLTNTGTLLADFSGGTQIFGNVNSTGLINVSGASPGANVFTGTFNGNVDNDNRLTVTEDALFKGLLTGRGDIDGNGTTVIEGTYSPDALLTAADDLLITGNLTTRNGGRLLLELGGLEAGTQYDNLNVIGTATLSDVDVVLVNGFVPSVGDKFVLISSTQNIGYTGGTRDQIVSLPDLPGDLDWEFCSAETPKCLTITVVPEPASLAIFGLGAAGLLRRRRR